MADEIALNDWVRYSGETYYPQGPMTRSTLEKGGVIKARQRERAVTGQVVAIRDDLATLRTRGEKTEIVLLAGCTRCDRPHWCKTSRVKD